jgi:hypothetical protein
MSHRILRTSSRATGCDDRPASRWFFHDTKEEEEEEEEAETPSNTRIATRRALTVPSVVAAGAVAPASGPEVSPCASRQTANVRSRRPPRLRGGSSCYTKARPDHRVVARPRATDRTATRTFLHELLHFSNEGIVANLPRDVRESFCDDHGSGKCYGAHDAAHLANALNITRWNWDQDEGQWIETPAAFNNIDNWREWLLNRFRAWEHCHLPWGAAVL